MTKIRKWLHRIQWANLGLLAAQGLNGLTGAFPALAANPYVLGFQALLGMILPSVAGISHALDGTVVVPKP